MYEPRIFFPILSSTFSILGSFLSGPGNILQRTFGWYRVPLELSYRNEQVPTTIKRKSGGYHLLAKKGTTTATVVWTWMDGWMDSFCTDTFHLHPRTVCISWERHFGFHRKLLLLLDFIVVYMERLPAWMCRFRLAGWVVIGVVALFLLIAWSPAGQQFDGLPIDFATSHWHTIVPFARVP